MKERKKKVLSARRAKRKNGRSVSPRESSAGLSVKDVLSELGKTDVVEFEYESGDFHIVIRKESVDRIIGEEPVTGEPREAAAVIPVSEKPKQKNILKSPAVGTFYFVNDERPLVSAGESVKKGKKLGVVNSMGIEQEIIAPTACKIVSILCTDSSAVEWGQELFEIEKN